MKKIISLALTVVLVFSCISTVTFAWSSYTHKSNFHKGLDMFLRYYPEYANNSIVADILSYNSYIDDAADDPDNFSIWSPDDVTRELYDTGQFWASHYMNPYTGLTYDSWNPLHPNWKPEVSAGYMAKRYVDYAAGQWLAGNKSYATYLLAYASHFITDASNPHHANLDISTEDADAIASWLPDFNQDTSHGEHETWQNNNYDYLFQTYNIASYENGYSLSGQAEDADAFRQMVEYSKGKSLSDFVYERMLHYGKQVYGKGDDQVGFDTEISDLTPEQMAQLRGQEYADLAYLGTVMVNISSNPQLPEYILKYKYKTVEEYNNWLDSAVAGLDASTEIMAEIIARFIHEVDYRTGSTTERNSDLIKIQIQTDDEYYSASDDIFYFGFKTAQGETDEITLDSMHLESGELQSYDAFETGQTNTFYMTLSRPFFIDNITSFYLRHEEVFIDDAWKPRNIKIFRNNVLVYESAINEFLENNQIKYYNLPNGINYSTQQPLGSINLQILTGHGTHEWTDGGGTEDEVYFGIRGTNGIVHEFYLGNYFTENSIKSSIFTIDNPMINWSNIQSMYLRKVNHDLPAGGTFDPEDAWRVDGVVIKADINGDGNREAVYAKDFGGRWIAESDNAIYEWNVNGISLNNEYFGIMEAEVGVLNKDDAGTDDNLHLDLEFADNTNMSYLLDSTDDDFGEGSVRSYYKVLDIQKKDIKSLKLRLSGDDEIGIASFMYKFYGLYGSAYEIYPKETLYDFLDPHNTAHDFLVPASATGSGLGTFKVSVKTDTDTDADTDDEVYMGIVFNNKYTLMLPLGLPNTNGFDNFERGVHQTKEFTVANPNYKWEEVTEVFFRKRKTNTFEDAWKIDSYTITRNGKNIKGASLNTWISDSYEAFHKIPVYGGINTDNNIIGFMKVTVSVGSTSDKSGIDSKLWLGVKANDNLWNASYCLEKPGGFRKGYAEEVYVFGSVNMPWELSGFTLTRDSGSSDEEFELQSLKVEFLEGNRGSYSQTFNEWITKTNTYAKMDRIRNYSAIGSFDVYMLTDSQDDSDTDDDIYIGFEFDNGDRFEKYLDISNVDDFERDSFNSYRVTIYNNDYNWNNLTGIYYVKRNGSDAWKVKAMSIVKDGKTIYAKEDNKWISSNNTIYDSTGNPLRADNNLIGFVKVNVKTKDGGIWDFYGTDDDIYMGLNIKGTWCYSILDTKENDFEEGDLNTFYVLHPWNVGTQGISMRKMSGGDDWYLDYVELSFPGRSWAANKYTFNKEYTSDNMQEFTKSITPGSVPY